MATLSGGAGPDPLAGGSGADTLLGAAGADTLLGAGGADLLTGGAGADLFVLQDAANATVDSRLGAIARLTDFNAAEGDRLALRAQRIGAAIEPIGVARFALSGAAPAPVAFAGSLGAAAAPIAGLALPDPTGGDVVRVFWLPQAGAPGGWVLVDADRDGGLGVGDLVLRIDGATVTAASFATGSFVTAGTTGADQLAATGAELLGLAGDDTLAGGDGHDTLRGGAGADLLAGGEGLDSLDGGDGADAIAGGAGLDVLVGGAGDDTLAGDDGTDLLRGGVGADALAGGAGDDSLAGEGGADTLDGGTGADTLRLQAEGVAAWSGLAAPALIQGFDRAAGDRLQVSAADPGGPDGRGATAGTFRGADGVVRALVFAGMAEPTATLEPGRPLPALPLGGLGAFQLYWLPAVVGSAPAGGWVVLDLDRDARVGAADLVVRVGSGDAPVTLGAGDFVAGTFLTLGAAAAPAGTAGDDTLAGGSLAETFVGTTGSDRIDGGAGAGNAVSYAALGGPIVVAFSAPGVATVAKPAGASDALRAITAIAGTAAADTLDGAAGGGGVFALSLEGRGGADLLRGDGTWRVQVSYAASPAAVSVDLALGTAADGWGAIDQLEAIARVAATSIHDDTLRGSDAAELFVSGAAGNRLIDGRGGRDTWRYGGAGAVTVELGAGRAVKPTGTDTLAGIEAAWGGDGNDLMRGGAGDDTLEGGAGADTLEGGVGVDRVRYDGASAGRGIATAGAMIDLAAGIATDPWGGVDALRGIEAASGSHLADVLAGPASARLLGFGGDDTLRGGVADYAEDPSGIDADLSAGFVRDGWGGRDRLDGVAGLVGSGFTDTLRGGMGADTLDGGAGGDVLIGGAGDDSYLVGRQDDLTFEAPDGGHDTAIATTGYYLWAFVEDLILTEGAADGFGVGNEAANRMTGNAGSNLLIGWDGADTLLGGAGIDALFGVAGADSLLGGAGIDYLVAGDGDDTLDGGDDPDALYGQDGDDLLRGGAGFHTDILIGGDGRDTLDGGVGLGEFDLLDGGAGDDTYHVDTPNDLTFEAAGGGHDRVIADITGAGYYLYPEVEDLELRGATPFGVGNALANRLTGAAGSNWLLGGAGDDTIDGGAGGDVLFGEAGRDVFVTRPGGGTDLIADFISGTDRLSLVDFGFSGVGEVLAVTLQIGTSVVIDLGGDDLLLLLGVERARLAAGDFVLE